MKKIDELNGVKVEAKIRGEYVYCVLSIASAVQFDSSSLLFCQDKISAGMVPDSKAKYYGKKYACGASEIDEFVDEKLGIFIYNNAPARKSAITEANYIYLNNSKIDFHKLKKIWGWFYCKNADSVNLPELTIIGEGAHVCDINTLRLPKIENISFFACINVSLDMPELKSLSCDIVNNINISAPNLIRADILNCNNKNLNMPKLEEVSILLQANEAESVCLPKLKKYGFGGFGGGVCSDVGWGYDIQFQKAKSIYMPELQTKRNVRILAFEAKEFNIGPHAKCQIFVHATNINKRMASSNLWRIPYKKSDRVVSTMFKWYLDGTVLAELILTRKDYKIKILRNYETGKWFYAVPEGEGWVYCKDVFEVLRVLKRKGFKHAFGWSLDN